MTAIHPDSIAYLRAASPKDTQNVVGQALTIWEHDAVQACVAEIDDPQMIDSEVQIIGDTTVSVSFITANGMSYPDLSIVTEQKSFNVDPVDDANLYLETSYSFSTRRKIFGLPRYGATAVYRSFNIQREGIESEEEGEIRPPLQGSWLTAKQHEIIEAGRTPHSSYFTIQQAEQLTKLLKQFDPHLFAVCIKVETEPTDGR
jgi:hypothetical protein